MATSADYTVGWICALEVEHAAACEVLDEEYTIKPRVDAQDHNSYSFGRIHEHNVVIACLPKGRYGITSAAIVADRMRASFSNIRIGLMVGIAGGAPSERHDIRLGDVVVSAPTAGYGGVLQYDYGKTIQNQDFEETGYLAPPPDILLNAVAQLESIHERRGSSIEEIVKKMKKYPRPEIDRLCLASYVHTEGCACDEHLVERKKSDRLVIHYGLIASANTLMKDAIVRDALVKKYEVLCFEMEAAGLMNNFPCLVVRGICDYSDSHKNKEWQGYAAATAAAYARELLEIIPGKHPKKGLIPFSLEGIPVTKRFVDRPGQIDMLKVLLSDANRRKIFVLSGLGGIGKTQLAVEFIRQHHAEFTSVFWLDGGSKDSLRQSFLRCASRIPAGKDWDLKVMTGEVATIVQAVLHWLELRNNTNWLMVFDNVDRENTESDQLSYDINEYVPQADHGSVLITTRLTRLQQLGESLELEKVDEKTARKMLSCWYKPFDADVEKLLVLLDGLPLAIAQAGALLYESGMSLKTYLRLYHERQQDVAESLHGSILQDYPDRSVWTTWSLSYEAVFKRDKFTAYLLVFWSFLNRNDIWFGLFERAKEEEMVRQGLTHWLGDISVSEIVFLKAMQVLRSYSLVEGNTQTQGYSMHTVVHQWVYLKEGVNRRGDIGLLALSVVGLATPIDATTNVELQWRLLPHAHTCCEEVLGGDNMEHYDELEERIIQQQYPILAIHHIGRLYYSLWKFRASEDMLRRAFHASQMVFGLDHGRTCWIAADIEAIFQSQKQFDEAERWLLQALPHGVDTSTDQTYDLEILNTRTNIYIEQSRIASAERLLKEILKTAETSLGMEDQITRNIVRNLARCYTLTRNFEDAEALGLRAVQGKKKIMGEKDQSTLESIYYLARIYMMNRRFDQAEFLSLEALQGFEDALGPNHIDTLRVAGILGQIYYGLKKFDESEKMLLKALKGYDLLEFLQETDPGRLVNLNVLGQLYMLKLNRPDDARVMFQRALRGWELVEDSNMCDYTKTVLQMLERRESYLDVRNSYNLQEPEIGEAYCT